MRKILIPDAVLAETSARAQGYVASGHLPLALVAVATPSKTLSVQAFNAEGGECPELTERRFPLASISKAVTSVAIARLVDQGVIDYTVPVANYVPEFGVDERHRRITVGDIFTHTTGLAAAAAVPLGAQAASAADCRRPLLEGEFVFEPGTHMQYNTLTYQLLNWIVERKLGLLMSAFLQEYLFAPCGMADTSFDLVPPERCVAAVDHPASNPADMAAFCRIEMSGAGLWSTAADLVALAQAVLTPGKFMSEQTFQRFTALQPSLPMWGTEQPSMRTWGWVKENRPEFSLQPASGFYHGGATGTLLWLDPDRKLIFVFLSNRWGSGNEHSFETLNVLYEGLD